MKEFTADDQRTLISELLQDADRNTADAVEYVDAYKDANTFANNRRNHSVRFA